MAEKGGKMRINFAHYLLGCRFDNWIRLLWQNKFRIAPSKIPMALCITAVSAVMFPVAMLEKLIYDRRIKRSAPIHDPVFIIGHWRSGTTYLQNILSRDPQFAWCDPVSTTTLSISQLLRKPLTKFESKVLKTARPMDNMIYRIDLPIEDTFGLATISPYSIIHMIAFPIYYRQYLPGAFVADLSPKALASWKRSYTYLINKLTWFYGGKQLMLKSPDNTAHIRQLLELYPDSSFVNIHRDPYTTVMSTIHMFKRQMDILRLSRLPDGDIDVILEDTIIYIFGRMYRELFELEPELPENRIISIAYEDLTRDPYTCLSDIYSRLELSGYEEALPRFREYIDAQKGYVKNTFTLNPRLREKINRELGFYFEHYGYEMETDS
ncbi:MAG: sulfotransferase [Clostridiales bacterium]|nr:sulfotransferase [Clostridiales bacterium]